ncbi:GNAT family N-acetyltransferase [Prauserella sp. ASG 168]|uniref:GNAT family N-acetyltransferase n=1 Tax=Prauserella cavernicola TaxID=2800127 RepID=A0A934QWK5_9PSEU|nr:GNAT family N-acetyltransferase [Prauserella cavernicola]
MRTSVPMEETLRRFDALFLILRRGTNEVLGFSTLQARSPAGHIRSGIYLDPAKARFGVGSEATHLTINYAFATFDLEKMILQTTEASFGGFGTALDPEEQEGILREHLYFRGRHWDLHSYKVTRDDWDACVDRFLDGVLPDTVEWREPPPH